MELKDKITSIDDYLKVEIPPTAGRLRDYMKGPGADSGWLIPSSCNIPFNAFMVRSLAPFPVGLSNGILPRQFWWVHREIMRMVCGIYPQATNAVVNIQRLQPYTHLLLHVSRDDPTQVAFTASIEDGMRDKQTRVTLGRFLRRSYNFITDDAIAQYEASHRMELNPPVKFIVAMDSPKEFVEAYKSLNSCMSKDISAYGTGSMHPVESYCAPGWQLAVLEKDGGGYSARSLVWINPEDSNDKRMVRTYGDAALTGWLQKNGFSIKNFVGAYLKTKVLKHHERKEGREAVVVPYMDPGLDRDPNGYGVWDGNDRVYLLDTHRRSNIPGEYHTSVQASGGVTYARAYPINRTCVISGEEINAIKEGFCEVWHEGKLGFAKAEFARTWKSVFIRYGKRGHVHPDAPVFKHGAGTYLEDDANREQLGYTRLSKTYYPEDQGWYMNGDAALCLSNAGYIRKEHAVQVIDENKTVALLHFKALPEGYVRVAAINDIRTWAAPKLETVRTAANRKAVPGVHDIVQGWDNKWYFRASMKQVNFLGTKIWIPVTRELTEMDLNELPPYALTQIDKAVADSEKIENAKRRALFSMFARQGDMLCPKEEATGGKLEALYLFEWRDMPLKLVEPWLRADWEDGKVVGAPESRMRALHKYGRLIVEAVEEKWAARAAPKKAAAAAEPAAAAA